ncbi:MAG: hypothetical protein COB02_14740 [Candidatus Cloacimonadota bacterium]|nr:MAG: hypothetical protein COB02_14740 [Candidatus Cloacimonadota bacterium]
MLNNFSLESVSKNKKYLLFIAFFQIICLALMLVNSSLPIYFGKEVLLKVVPVDPRSLFRGNYVILNYDFSRFSSKKLIETPNRKLMRGTAIYVKLKKINDTYTIDRASLSPFKEGIFIKGKLKYPVYFSSDKKRVKNRDISASFNIEAFFTNKSKAKQLELKRNQKKLKARVFILPNGKAAIDSLIE